MLASSTAALPTASHSASSLHMVEGSPAAELLQRMNSPTKKAAMLRSWVAESERSSYEDLPAARDPAHHPHTMTEHVEHSWMKFDGVPENEEAVRLYDQVWKSLFSVVK